ncbi:hypothetical protein SPRG_18847 [Saprolegnia parasitica CBS 223.65]|uniref:Uncharacterized protein n=1 Tax=Saprolegnia parasitica (strain CBS 223.65) TaxID=695850 RepID=A0A067CYE7_SAPPC|nr:hypothetical protein SPRG_18847 [Saprolegnia parasitica CBS 223.65]KDO35689.1 hypothetical protein SPRG_18847 [Saprolegnia parasitica CBS 223.65]|eukprot:XP_012194063.1 hypothetical protein SPRG_18847 [Saprolegnia parasitica CBS 223.65]
MPKPLPTTADRLETLFADALRAQEMERSRLAIRLFTQIIDEDDAGHDTIVYQAYVHKYKLECSFLLYKVARATANAMLERFHGAHEAYLLKARAEAKLNKSAASVASIIAGLAHNPIHGALLRELEENREVQRQATSATERSKPRATFDGPPYSMDIVDIPDTFVGVEALRTVPSRYDFFGAFSADLIARLDALEAAPLQLSLLSKPVVSTLARAASLAPRSTNLAKLCMPRDFVLSYYEAAANASSSLYERDCGVILSRAVHLLETLPFEMHCAFVLDIDDTALVSYGYMKSTKFEAIPMTQFQYLVHGSPPANPMVLRFYAYLKWKGVEVVFVSERPERTRDATLRALFLAGYREDILVLRQPNEHLMSTANFKQRARAKLQKEYKIIGCLGDQFGDITGNYTGARFKLPNYLYTVE